MKNPLRQLVFFRSCFNTEDFPKMHAPQIVICGKSNVGKSSLINHLSETHLAKTSQIPGKTRSLNFYGVESRFFLVDLPGYGFAKGPKKEKQDFKVLVDAFFALRQERVLLFLLDARHMPTVQDEEMFEYLTHFDIPFCVILTKADKLKKNERDRAKKNIEEFFGLKSEPILYSVKEKFGKEALLARLKEFGIFE
ncbi:MAG: putative GTP-binding protein EngB [Chlamydiae bacterium]|nr:putative GTP-binding protein EngB [Chlamydiota bacterium]